MVSTGGDTKTNRLLVAGADVYERDICKEDQPKEIETAQDPERCFVWLQKEREKPWR